MKGARASLLGGMFAAGAVGAAGCGSSSSSTNGVTNESAQQILQSAASAVKGAQSFQASSGSPTLKIDVRVFSNGDLRGTITEKGGVLTLIVADKKDYLSASPATWESLGVPASQAAPLKGKFVVLSSASASSLGTVTFSKVETQLAKPGGTLSKIGTKTINGQSVVGVRYTGNSSNPAATWYIATTGPAYPVEYVRTGSGATTVTVSGWNSGSPPTPPTNTTIVAGA